MADRQETTTLYKKEIKFPASLGDWTKYKPLEQAPKRIKPFLLVSQLISKYDLVETLKIHNFFSMRFAQYLKTALKASIDIFDISMEQLTYMDFLKRVTEGVYYNKISIKDIGDIMLLLDFPLANLFINFSLGFQSVDAKTKEPTELEESILQSIFNASLDQYSNCWGNIFEKPGFEIISYPGITRETHINLNEVVTIMNIKLSVANSAPSSISFIYQNITLQKLIELLEKKSSKIALNLSSLPEELLSSLDIPVSAELGTTNVPTKDLIHIEEGDLVSLEQRLDEPIVLKIGNVTSFKVQPGIKNNHIAVRMLKSGSRKILGEQIEKIDMDKPSPPALQAQLDTAIPKKEDTMLPGNANAEEFELPLEEETKEEYNENEENIFGEEQSPEKHGGV